MAYEGRLECVPGLVANGDLSAHQFKCMRITNGKANLAGAGEIVVGVLQNKPGAANLPAAVATDGVSKIVLGGTVAAGALVMPDSNGKAVTATTGNFHFGVLLVGGDADELGSVLLGVNGYTP